MPFIVPLIPAIAAAAGSAMSAAAKAKAANRGQQLQASVDQDRLRLDRQAEDRAERGDAWQKLQNAAYILNEAKPYTPPSLTGVRGTYTLPTFGIARSTGPSASELAGATGLEREVLRRLVGGSQLPPLTDISKYTKMGGWEKFFNIAGPALGALGSAKFGGGGGGRTGQIVSRTGQYED